MSINYETGTLQVLGEISEIRRWEVHFRVPVGIFSSVQEAVNWCHKHDLDPELIIRPVPVAFISDTQYEVMG